MVVEMTASCSLSDLEEQLSGKISLRADIMRLRGTLSNQVVHPLKNYILKGVKICTAL